MIFTACGAMRPFNGRGVGFLETEIQGSLELGYMAPLDSELHGSQQTELLGSY